MQKLQKAIPLSSLIWAAIVTAIVLALAASANAQEDNTSGSVPTIDNIRPLPKTAPLMPRATSSVPRTIDKPMERPTVTNASGTRSMITPDVSAKREAAVGLMAEKMATFEERRVALMEEVEVRRASLTEKRVMIASSTLAKRAVLKQEVQKRVVERAGGLTTAVEKAITDLEGMIVRLREHANKFAAKSVDVSDTLATLNEAEKLLQSAKEALKDIGTNVSYATLSETPKEDWADAKDQFMSVRDILQEVRALLAEAVASLKASTPRTSDESVNN